MIGMLYRGREQRRRHVMPMGSEGAAAKLVKAKIGEGVEEWLKRRLLYEIENGDDGVAEKLFNT